MQVNAGLGPGAFIDKEHGDDLRLLGSWIQSILLSLRSWIDVGTSLGNIDDRQLISNATTT